MMKLPAIFVVCVLLFLHAARVESGSTYHKWYNVFAFGDSFADNGNVPKDMGELSRAWFFPYGTSFKEYNGNPNFNPTGRFSDYMVQTDFLAKILGLHQAPHAYKHSFLHIPRYGMTFATGVSGVFEVPQKVDTLAKQVDKFEKLVTQGTISRTRLLDSVFLVAVSGNDYVPSIHLMTNSTSGDAMTALIGNVTTEIAANVARLQKLGATKILVNNMHPIGCTPRHTRASNYTSCDAGKNGIASIHNSNLEEKLAASNSSGSSVLMLDLNTAFTDIIVGSSTGEDDSPAFTHKLEPCCEANDPIKGYCGLQAKPLEFQFKLDTGNEANHFYWDDMHPTHAGWEAVMKQFEQPIKEFLDRD